MRHLAAIGNNVNQIANIVNRGEASFTKAELLLALKQIERVLVTLGETTLKLAQGQSCDIAIGQVHRLANTTDALVEIVEVQFGDYLGEDDIVRLQDDYGRN